MKALGLETTLLNPEASVSFPDESTQSVTNVSLVLHSECDRGEESNSKPCH